MYYIETPNQDYKTKRWREVVEFFANHTHIDAHEIPGKCPPDGLYFGRGDYLVNKEDGRALRDVPFAPTSED